MTAKSKTVKTKPAAKKRAPAAAPALATPAPARAQRAMTVAELCTELLKQKAHGRSNWPVYLQEVDARGVTSAIPCRLTQGDPADGKLFWIWAAGPAANPDHTPT